LIQVSILDFTVVAFFLGGLVLLAAWIASRQRRTEDFFLGGKRLPPWALGLSLAANQVSAISLVGAPAFVALAEGGGLIWLQYELAVPLAMAALLIWGVPVLRQARGSVVYDAIEVQFGSAPRRLLAAFFLVGRGLSLGVILYASALVVDACTDWGLGVCVITVGLVAVAYTALGGLTADVISDVLQLLLLWGGTLVATVMLIIRFSKAGQLLSNLPLDRMATLDVANHGLGDGATFAMWPMLLGGFFLYLSYYGCDQTQAQRLLATESENGARQALFVAAVVRFPMVLTYCALGVLLAILLSLDVNFASLMAHRPPDALVPQFVVHFLPSGIRGVVIAGFLAAALSSIDSALNSLSAVTLEELLPTTRAKNQRFRLFLARLVTVLWGVFACFSAFAFARAAETSIELVNRVGSALSGPILAVFVLAWRSRRATSESTVVGACAGVVANLLFLAFAPGLSWLWWNVIGCFVTICLGSLLGRAERDVSKSMVTEARKETRAISLVAYFILIVCVLILVHLAVAK
jgi:SSS family solute:Na+ symporter